MKTIETLQLKVKNLLPPDWKASRCMMMSMSGATSPEMINVHRGGWDELLVLITKKDFPKEQRLERRKAWRTETEYQATQIEARLKLAGLKVSRDGGSLYVKPN